MPVERAQINRTDRIARRAGERKPGAWWAAEGAVVVDVLGEPSNPGSKPMLSRVHCSGVLSTIRLGLSLLEGSADFDHLAVEIDATIAQRQNLPKMHRKAADAINAALCIS